MLVFFMVFDKYLLLAASLQCNFGGIGKTKAESEGTFGIHKYWDKK